MIEIRIHGRGGQGNVTMAQLIAMAAFYDGKYTQAFPMFGVERKGAPVKAFVKINNKFILSRQQIYNPNVLIVQDPTLLSVINVMEGAKKDAKVIVNSKEKLSGFSKAQAEAHFIPALDIALKHIGKPIINTAMLGAFAAITNLADMKSIKKAIEVKLGEKYGKDIINKNIAALEEAYNITKI